MPGKVNPVIPEAAAMVAAEVIGNDAAITIGGQSGNFQLNVMLPLIAYNLLESIRLLANVLTALADRAIAGFTVNEPRLREALERNPILVTALNSIIGYEKGAAIAKKAYAQGLPIRDMAQQMTDLKSRGTGQTARSPGADSRRHQGRRWWRRLNGRWSRSSGSAGSPNACAAAPRDTNAATGCCRDLARRRAAPLRHSCLRCWCRRRY